VLSAIMALVVVTVSVFCSGRTDSCRHERTEGYRGKIRSSCSCVACLIESLNTERPSERANITLHFDAAAFA